MALTMLKSVFNVKKAPLSFRKWHGMGENSERTSLRPLPH